MLGDCCRNPGAVYPCTCGLTACNAYMVTKRVRLLVRPTYVHMLSGKQNSRQCQKYSGCTQMPAEHRLLFVCKNMTAEHRLLAHSKYMTAEHGVFFYCKNQWQQNIVYFHSFLFRFWAFFFTCTPVNLSSLHCLAITIFSLIAGSSSLPLCIRSPSCLRAALVLEPAPSCHAGAHLSELQR